MVVGRDTSQQKRLVFCIGHYIGILITSWFGLELELQCTASVTVNFSGKKLEL